LLLVLAGCEPVPGSCGYDVLGCGPETLTFELADDCSPAEREGEIMLVVGEGDGEGGFRALDSSELPKVHHGSQGGQHMWTGFQIRNPNPARSLHRVEFSVQACDVALDCSLDASWTNYDSVIGGTRELVVDDEQLRETAAGWLELRDVLLLLSDDADEPEGLVRMVVTAQDTCDRRGELVHGG
jgi:hypothetical protein